MIGPIGPTKQSIATTNDKHKTASTAEGKGTFSRLLKTGPTQQANNSPVQQSQPLSKAESALADMDARRKQIDDMISRSMRGEKMSAEQLLVWQARVYTYSQQVEVFSRVVDRTVSAIKTTMNTQA